MGVVDDRWLEGVSRRHDHGLGTELQRSWEAHLDQQEISEFVERIADHPWVIPATDLPTGVQVAMEHEYITPLRELRRWYETVDGAIASLSSDDEDALLSAADDFADVEPLSEAVDYDVEELEGDSTDSPKSLVIVGRTRSIRSACFLTTGRTSTDGWNASSRVES